jgi:hypothetical protein
MAGRSCVRIPAPAFVISVTAHGRTPVCAPKNKNASLPIFVLPIDRRLSIVRVLNDPLVDPVSPVVPSPDATDNKLAGNRSSRNDDGPEVPKLCPGGLGSSVQHLKIVVALRGHLRRRTPSVRAHGASCSRAVVPNRSSSWTCLRSRCHSRNRLARPPCEVDGFGVLCFDARRESEEIICGSLCRCPFYRIKPPGGIYSSDGLPRGYFRTLGNVRCDQANRFARRCNETPALSLMSALQVNCGTMLRTERRAGHDVRIQLPEQNDGRDER